jgi:carbon monoxide dehydrogenase subunit G
MQFAIKEQIDRSADEVFAALSNFSAAADMISGITKTEMLTEGPVGMGTRFRETRVMFGREATEEMEVTAFEVPHRYVLGGENHGCRYASEFLLTPKGGGTEVSMSFEATPLTLVAKIMSVLMRPMMKSMAKHCMQDLKDVKTFVEGGA